MNTSPFQAMGEAEMYSRRFAAVSWLAQSWLPVGVVRHHVAVHGLTVYHAFVGDAAWRRHSGQRAACAARTAHGGSGQADGGGFRRS